MKQLRIFITTLVLCTCVYVGNMMYHINCEQRIYKSELTEISKVKYGLFSIDEWKAIVTDIITKKIEEFDLQGEDREIMRAKIEGFLWEAVEQIEAAFKSENNRTDFLDDPFEWANQQIKVGVSDFVDVFGTIRRDIPNLTDRILTFLDKEENRENLRRFILKQINAYADKTFTETDYTLHDQIISRYGSGDRMIAKVELESAIEIQQEKARHYLFVLLAVFVTVVILTLFSKSISSVEIILLSLISMAFLIIGLALPMIEIDARIEQFNFQLLGEPVAFADQVLYYKSKSILEVVNLLISQDKAEILMVGLLVLLFSVIFPLLKLFATGLYCLSPGLKESKLVQFLVFRTGKWSMADVLVIAIMMAYIGFDGIITDQLNQLEGVSQGLDIFTTNQSTLQMGFFFFTGFVLLSLVISHRMQYAPKVIDRTL